MIAVLRQLRAGHDERPSGFPQSVILCGVRDVRDYRIHSAAENTVITGGSAFNVKAASLRMGDFSETEVRELLAQHTAETGQRFADAALQAVWELTAGQPWLVNALAREACFGDEAGRDRTRAISAEAIHVARERLILRRETHLDQLTDKLQEERVRRVIGPLLSGSEAAEIIRTDDLQYVRDLGLVARDAPVRIANPIYREVIPRDLTWTTQEFLPHDPAWYVDSDGGLNLTKLLAAFQEFFREHSEHWIERFQYREARAAVAVAGVPASHRQFGWPRGARVRAGKDADRPADRMAVRGAARADPADGDRVQAAARQPAAHHPRGAGADPELPGPMRGRRRPPW